MKGEATHWTVRAMASAAGISKRSDATIFGKRVESFEKYRPTLFKFRPSIREGAINKEPLWRTALFGGIALLAISILGPRVLAAPPGGHLNVTEVVVDFGPPDTITIIGADFDFGGPLEVTLGEFGLRLSGTNGSHLENFG